MLAAKALFRQFDRLAWSNDRSGMELLVAGLVQDLDALGDSYPASGARAILLIRALRWLGRESDAQPWKNRLHELATGGPPRPPYHQGDPEIARVGAKIMDIGERFGAIVFAGDRAAMVDFIAELQSERVSQGESEYYRFFVSRMLQMCLDLQSGSPEA